eukprot:scaffold2653_cov176-Ochromonas_danica.AAC.2
MAAIQQTKNAHLQTTLNSWVELLAQACQLSSRAANPQGQGPFREEKIEEFVRSFVPLDVEEADIEHYGNNLKNDEEFFASLVRELFQCATGQSVESIEVSPAFPPSTPERVTFFLLPPEGTCKPVPSSLIPLSS